MKEWKTYIIDDATPFHGIQLLGRSNNFNTLLIGTIALIVTNGEYIRQWSECSKKYILKNPNEHLSLHNLKDDFKREFDFDDAKHHYKKIFDIDISEPIIYRPRKITI